MLNETKGEPIIITTNLPPVQVLLLVLLCTLHCFPFPGNSHSHLPKILKFLHWHVWIRKILDSPEDPVSPHKYSTKATGLILVVAFLLLLEILFTFGLIVVREREEVRGKYMRASLFLYYLQFSRVYTWFASYFSRVLILLRKQEPAQ